LKQVEGIIKPTGGKMIDRIMGVITLKAPVYREIADDATGTPQAAMVLVVATLIAQFFSGLIARSSTGAVEISIIGAFISAILGLVVGLVAWVFTAWVLATVAKMLDGKTDTGEMLRVTGYVRVFSLISIINIFQVISPALGCVTTLISFAVAVLSLIGYVIGVREAAEFTTGKAIITGIVATVVNFIIIFLIGGAILGLLLAAVGLSR
jgi:hypothetical protein